MIYACFVSLSPTIMMMGFVCVKHVFILSCNVGIGWEL